MRGLLDGRGWVEIEQCDEVPGWIRRPQFSIVDDPEAGIFDEEEFEEIKA